MKEKSECRSRTARCSKTAAWVDIQREDDEAIDEILFLLKRFMVSIRNDLNLFPLETAISLLQHATKKDHSKEELSILHHHLRRALLTRYSFFGYIEDLEACFVSLSEGISIVVAKGKTGGDIEKVEEIQAAIQLIDECRQSIDTAALDDIIEVAMESIQLYTEGKQVLQKAELLILLGNAIGMRYIDCLEERDLELTYAANKFREAEYLCAGNVPLTYICHTALAHVGWVQTTECGRSEGMIHIRDHIGRALAIDEEGVKSFEIGSKMAEEAVGISQMQEAITHLRFALHCRMPHHPQRPSTLDRLANALTKKHGWGSGLEDLEESILLRKEGLRLMSTHYSHRAMWLNNLANNLCARFQQKGAFHDLEECILLHREALDLRPPPHPDRSRSLNNLANGLWTRFQQKRAMQDLEECILLHREALDLQPPPHPDRSGSLNNLANGLLTRFEQKGAIQDLEECILLHREALDLLPPPHSDRSASLNNLAAGLWTRFEQKGAMQDLEECILLYREALDLRPPPHPDRSRSLNNLANGLLTRFEQKGAIQDLEECILLHREALDLLPPPHSDRSASLNNLAAGLWTRFEQKGAMQDLEECILLHQEALDLRPPPHPDRSRSLNNLANGLWTRFEQKGAMQDLEECILLYREALDLRPPPHPDRSRSLNNLANGLWTRFQQKRAMQDLEECILLYREALDLRPPPHPDRSASLNNLANGLWTRFQQKGAMQDLEECILLHREALDLRPPPHSDRSGSLNNLAAGLSTRFEQKGAMQDLEECILLHQEALDLLPPPHPDRSTSLNNLANGLSKRFQQKGAMQDLEECILLYREALDLRPPPHSDRSGSLNNLAAGLWTRFQQKGAMQDLEECILLYREALDLLPPPHPDRSASLNNLANVLSTRFEQKGAMQDLEECILLHREALDLRPPPHPDRSRSLNNLANGLSTRFQQKGAMQDLEECILLHREALDLLPPPHPDRSGSLNNLANGLWTRFEQKGAMQDLEECILLHREALDLLPPPHPDRSRSLNNLAAGLLTRFEQKGAMQDLEECILLHREALDLRPPPHPDRLGSLNNLATSHSYRYGHKNEVADLEQVLRYYELASCYETGSMLQRLNSAKACATFARMHRPTAALDAYLYALELLPQLASIDLPLKQRQDVLEHSRELVGNAAQCAISQNQLDTAVVWLSTSRSIFWSQALQLRTPVDELATVNPSLAETYLDISRRLEQASHGSTYPSHTSLASDRHTSNQSNFTSLSTLVDHRRQTIEDIRKIPGFEAFLLPPSFLSLRHAARNGPVILLNASKFGCDALIMRESGAVDHVPLPDIELIHLKALGLLVHTSLAGGWRSTDGTQPEVQTAIELLRTLLPRDLVPNLPSNDRDPLGFVLNILWDNVVRHVVEALALHKNTSPKRIWWCPTGSFASLPIHAAGRYSDNNEPIDCLFQYAVSSYCTSPKDLVHPQTHISLGFKMAAIIEPEAPGGDTLPFTVAELERIMSHIPDPWQQLIVRLGFKDAPNQIEDVISDIQQSSIVHFGCHGNQNLRDPLESYLLLSGGKLTISRIIKECQLTNSAGLAYLSACETAKGDEDRLDESLNLVASMMFAGFKSVVGTMWSIFDCDAPIVADVFYGHLFQNGKDGPVDLTDAAYGLHLATEHLREQGRGFRSWVPYVYYGI